MHGATAAAEWDCRFPRGRAGRAVGLDGGVGAAESAGGLLAAVGVGADSLALGVLAQPGAALVATGPGSQAFIGDATDPVLCVGGMALAVNFTTGQGCVMYGTFGYTTAPRPDGSL